MSFYFKVRLFPSFPSDLVSMYYAFQLLLQVVENQSLSLSHLTSFGRYLLPPFVAHNLKIFNVFSSSYPLFSSHCCLRFFFLLVRIPWRSWHRPLLPCWCLDAFSVFSPFTNWSYCFFPSWRWKSPSSHLLPPQSVSGYLFVTSVVFLGVAFSLLLTLCCPWV